MVTCKLMGGLGNQMFQIATTYAYALRHDLSCSFDLNDCYTPNQGSTSINYKDNIFLKIRNEVPTGITKQYHEPKFSYDEIPVSDNMLLYGSFQSEKYFSDYQEEIQNLFVIPYALKQVVNDYLENIGISLDRPITSVHVRRGDYLGFSGFHPTCSLEYYTKAMEAFKGSQFIFISDDMSWVMKNFKGKNIFYSNMGSEVLDLVLQTKCDNNIIANSSFSWWGAYLNKNPNKVVIAPSQWFGPTGHKDTQDIIPDNWIKY